MNAHKGEEKLVFSAKDGRHFKKCRKLLSIVFGIFAVLFLALTIAALIRREWGGAVGFAVLLALAIALFLFAFFGEKIFSVLGRKRIEFYSDRVVFLHEQAWAWPSMQARYEDIRGACINKADEVGDHVRIRTHWGDRDADTLCVYCKGGEYILFGIEKWGEQNSRRILDEILRRADVPESQPEEGEYGGGSKIAAAGFAALGVEEEPQEDDPAENRFDIEAIVGCMLYTENGVNVGKVVRVLPAETDLYIVERDGKEVQLSAEEGLILDIDAEKKKMIVDADIFAKIDKRNIP